MSTYDYVVLGVFVIVIVLIGIGIYKHTRYLAKITKKELHNKSANVNVGSRRDDVDGSMYITGCDTSSYSSSCDSN